MQQTDLGLNLSTKKTRKREFLEQMQQLVPLKDLVAPAHTVCARRSQGPPYASCRNAAAHSFIGALAVRGSVPAQ